PSLYLVCAISRLRPVSSASSGAHPVRTSILPMDLPLEGADLELESRLRGIRRFAWAAAAVWVVLAAVGTVLISDRLLAAYLEEASHTAETDAVSIVGAVNRMFHELDVIPRILSSNPELRAIVTKYDHEESKFSLLAEEERARELKADPLVARAGERLT